VRSVANCEGHDWRAPWRDTWRFAPIIGQSRQPAIVRGVERPMLIDCIVATPLLLLDDAKRTEATLIVKGAIKKKPLNIRGISDKLRARHMM
jgi:hypothetical protein